LKVTGEIITQQAIENKNKARKSLISAKDQEIKGIKKHYDKRVEEQRVVGEKEVWEAQDIRKVELTNAMDLKEKQLEHVNKQLTDDTTRLKKEHKNVAADYRQRISDTVQIYDQKNRDIYAASDAKNRELNEEKIAEVKSMEGSKNTDIIRVNTQTEEILSQVEADHGRRINSQLEQNQFMKKREQQVFDERFKKVSDEHKDIITEQVKVNTYEKKEKNIIHQEELKRQDKYQEALLMQDKEAFESRYTKIQETHKKTMDTIMDRFDNETKQMMNSHTDRKHLVATKAEDKFYRVETINHTVVDKGDAYEVGIKFPEHEKETVVLAVDKRKVHFNFTRRFKDSMVEETGAESKTKRSEIYSKNFDLPEILDPAKITREYKDGTLTFRIGKA
jgi:HSP20 family molecular chaperone IbpA